MPAIMDGIQAKRILQRDFFPSYEEALQAFRALTSEERKEIFIHKTRPVFEILNRSYVNALARYIVASGFRTVLDVGAGDGRLAKYLEEAIRRVFRREKKKDGGRSPEESPVRCATEPFVRDVKETSSITENGARREFVPAGIPRVLSIDNGSWNIIEVFPVEKLDLQDALEKYNPDLAIWCWMPIGDWTWVFRRHPSVREYLLIGETDGGFCGNDQTWSRAIHEADGFTRHDLDDLSALQLARNDEDPPPSRSRTVAFRRTPIGR